MKVKNLLSLFHVAGANGFQRIVTDRKTKVNDYLKDHFYQNEEYKLIGNSSFKSNIKSDNTKENTSELEKVKKLIKPLNQKMVLRNKQELHAYNSNMLKRLNRQLSNESHNNSSIVSDNNLHISASMTKVRKMKSLWIKPMSPIRKPYAEIDIIHRNSSKKYYSMPGTTRVLSPKIKNTTVRSIQPSVIHKCKDNISESELLNNRIQRYKDYLWKKNNGKPAKKKKGIFLPEKNATKGLSFNHRFKIILQSKAIDKLAEDISFKYRTLMHNKFKIKDFDNEVFNYPPPEISNKDNDMKYMKENQEYHLSRANQCLRELKKYQNQFDDLHKEMLAQSASADNLLSRKKSV